MFVCIEPLGPVVEHLFVCSFLSTPDTFFSARFCLKTSALQKKLVNSGPGFSLKHPRSCTMDLAQPCYLNCERRGKIGLRAPSPHYIVEALILILGSTKNTPSPHLVNRLRAHSLSKIGFTCSTNPNGMSHFWSSGDMYGEGSPWLAPAGAYTTIHALGTIVVLGGIICGDSVVIH